ncbi:uncharacterized protein KZ484_018910 isoform 3-T4 [Pholidichthys leucotaenia]
MSEKLVFYSETKLILETLLRSAVEILGRFTEKAKLTDQNVKPDVDAVVEMFARETARKISSVFCQLSSLLQAENRTLKDRVEKMEGQLKTATERFENARLWREHILNGDPVLFQPSGLVFTLKLSGKLMKIDEGAEGVGASSAPPPPPAPPPAVVGVPGERGADSCSEGGDVEEDLISSPATVCDVSEDFTLTDTAQPTFSGSPQRRDNEVRKNGGRIKCGVCNQTFEQLIDVMAHTETHMTQEDRADTDEANCPKGQKEMEAEASLRGSVFVCNICDKTFTQMIHLTKHMNIHSEQSLFPCDQCPKKFIKAANLQRHLLRHEEKKLVVHECQLCEKKFKTIGSLNKHQRVHTEQSPFLCPTCGKSFRFKHNLRSHQSLHKDKSRHECPECGQSFKHSFTLQCHRRSHRGEPRYKCDVCGKVYEDRRGLWSHQRVHSGKTFTCETCGISFTAKPSLQRHIRLHTGERPYKCEVCGKDFIRDTQLKVHMLLHGADKAFMCDLCGKRFLYNCQLKNHQKVAHTHHSSQGRRGPLRAQGRRVIYRQDATTVDVAHFRCNTCHKGFDTASDLERHEKIHTRQQYTCDTCGKLFLYKEGYDNHQRNHFGERPFACDVCGKTFIVRSTLDTHKLRHSGEKPHKCKTCGKAFRCSSTLYRHKLIHTGEKPYECEVCRVRFRQLSHVKYHMRIHTGVRPSSAVVKKRRKCQGES